jgi:hypothetical protein
MCVGEACRQQDGDVAFDLCLQLVRADYIPAWKECLLVVQHEPLVSRRQHINTLWTFVLRHCSAEQLPNIIHALQQRTLALINNSFGNNDNGKQIYFIIRFLCHIAVNKTLRKSSTTFTIHPFYLEGKEQMNVEDAAFPYTEYLLSAKGCLYQMLCN